MITPTWYRHLDSNSRRAFRSTYAGFSVDAMNVQLYSFVLPVLLTLWHFSPSAGGLLATVTLVASAAGGWLAGLLSDRLGRVRVLQVTILWMAVSTTLCGLAQNYEQLLVARTLQGFGFGAEWAVGAVLMGEIATAATRGRLVGTAQSAWAIGWGLAAAMSFVAIAVLPPPLGWRAAFFVSLPAVAAIFLARTRLRESATFLASPCADAWHRIFSPGMCGNTARGCLLAIGTHGGYWALATWWPTMLRLERGLSAAETATHMAVLVSGSLAGYIFGASLADRIGRRATLALFALGGIATVLVATGLSVSAPVLLALGVPLGVFAMGLYSAIGPVLNELYPTRLRGSGLGFCYNVGRGVAGFTPFAVGGSISAFGIAHSIGIYVSVAYVLVLIAAALLHETKGMDFMAAPTAA
ncbi:MFS transporter [Sphingomonas sp. So64.6b]|uniref:MFS transporter n=1 Tax=Sphingomonas sp. So64.6b TaxID=2997354 RepID=UPI001600C35C|nr:MFS transporter [Sphingomonas sp. So64.6b]QNA85463.1 MFS transporter [Sphingomonas sp. So64.6b]